MLSFVHKVGRLLELRALSPLTMPEMMQGVKDITTILGACPKPMVCCADFRYLGIMADDVTQVIVKTMRSDNPRIERAGYVIPKANAVAGLQWERLVREGLNPARKIFREVPGVLSWLDDLLDGDEKARLRQFYEDWETTHAGMSV